MALRAFLRRQGAGYVEEYLLFGLSERTVKKVGEECPDWRSAVVQKDCDVAPRDMPENYVSLGPTTGDVPHIPRRIGPKVLAIFCSFSLFPVDGVREWE